MTKRPLSARGSITSDDVKCAIIRMVNGHLTEPLAIHKAGVTKELIKMANPGVEILEVTRISQSIMFSRALNRGSLFQRAFKSYEDETENPIVPVSDPFYEWLFSDYDVISRDDENVEQRKKRERRIARKIIRAQESRHMLSDRLEAMTDEQIRKALPGRRKKISSIIVFPPSMLKPPPILAFWIRNRLGSATKGALDNYTDALGHVQPSTARIRITMPQLRS